MAEGVSWGRALLAERRFLLAERRALAAEVAFVLLACALFLAFVLPNLANHPAPTDDEIWILSASHKLATKGVFGTDLFAGFYRADEVYFFNMPLHHVVLAAVFKVAGTSVFAGRLVSVAYGLIAIALAYAFGRRLHGVAGGVLATGLLLFLRLNIGFDTGLPLQETARSIRYDLAPVPFTLAASLVLLKPTPRRALLAGALLSLATLMQFYAAFFFLPAAIYLLLENRTLKERARLLLLMGAAAAIVALPYAAYIAPNLHEFEGQTSTLERRINFTDPEFYVRNVERE
ncbi:MAG TPA: glycosyltransferase family 39 protein, partial [Dehalococcoidia bacterium]|nr:glycosyltransferase family 39 protein [Dehalococcoidia bacterium]